MIEAILALSLNSRQVCAVSLDQSQIYACYPMAIGKQSTPTPTGQFEVTRLVSDPQYVSCQTGKNYGTGFLGDYAIVTNLDTVIPNCKFAIHGTNTRQANVRNGDMISGGCANMLNSDIEHLVTNFSIQGGIIN